MLNEIIFFSDNFSVVWILKVGVIAFSLNWDSKVSGIDTSEVTIIFCVIVFSLNWDSKVSGIDTSEVTIIFCVSKLWHVFILVVSL